jgi:hypothetical protein
MDSVGSGVSISSVVGGAVSLSVPQSESLTRVNVAQGGGLCR